MFLNDEEYAEDEQWMAECTDKYTRFTIEVHEYLESIKGDKVRQAAIMVESNESGVAQSGEVVVRVQANDAGELEVESSAVQQNTSNVNKPLLMKHEKPKMPMFYGDVRKYFIFKADFQHAVEKYYSERDAITILRSCLGPEPAKLIEGISSDLKSAWNYLDQNYGDPRIVSWLHRTSSDSRLCSPAKIIDSVT